jgi:hypothetical protein
MIEVKECPKVLICERIRRTQETDLIGDWAENWQYIEVLAECCAKCKRETR